MYPYKLLTDAHIRDMQREARDIRLSKMAEGTKVSRVRPSLGAVAHFMLMLIGR
jgi:hypothetical protein